LHEKGRAGARPFSWGICAGLEALFAGKWNTLAAIEDLADGVEEQPQEARDGDGDHKIMVLAHDMTEGVDEGGSEPDGEQGAGQELRELSAKDRQEKRSGLHLEDAGGELEEFEWGWRWEHRRDHDGEELLTLEAVADALVTFAVDALEEEKLATRTANEKRHERAESRGCGGHEAINQKAVVVGRDIPDDDAVHGDRNGDERGVDEGEAADAPDAERLEDR